MKTAVSLVAALALAAGLTACGPSTGYNVPFCVEKKAANLAASIPGTGMNVPIRYTTSAPTRNNSRLRISAKRVISPSAAAALLDVATSVL